MLTEELNKIFQKFSKAKIAVLGDAIIDHTIYGQCDRISPEAPVPVVQYIKETMALGGSANVAKNIAALGGNSTLLCLCGPDDAGHNILNLCNENGIDCRRVVSGQRQTTVKTRITARQQLLRLDREDIFSASKEEQNSLLEALQDVYEEGVNVLVVSDYAKGCITLGLMDTVRSSFPKLRVIVDPKPVNALCYSGSFLAKPNLKEAEFLSGMSIRTRQDVVLAGQRIMTALKFEKLVITLGEQGMAVFESVNDTAFLPTVARDVFDVTGAGDTVIAVLALSLAASFELKKACLLANYAAGIVVSRTGTVSVTAEQIFNMCSSCPDIYYDEEFCGAPENF